MFFFFFFQAEDGIRDADVTGVQTCALPISYGIDFRRTLSQIIVTNTDIDADEIAADVFIQSSSATATSTDGELAAGVEPAGGGSPAGTGNSAVDGRLEHNG